jgi:hypothetical protein
VGRGHEGVLAAGYVAADGLDGDVLVAKDDTGQGLDFEVEHGRPLGLRETPDLGLGELDVLDGLGRHPAVAGLDFGAAQPERRGAPLVEPFGVVPNGGVAAGGDVGDDVLDGVADGGVFGFADFDRLARLEVANHGGPRCGVWVCARRAA